MAIQITTNPGSGSGNPYIDSLVWGNASWSLDEPINVGFWSGYSTEYDATSQTWSNGELLAFYQAMANYSAVSNLTFNVISNPSESLSSSNTTDIIWYQGTDSGFGLSGLAGWHEVPNGAYTWLGGAFNSSSSTWSNLTPGSWGYITVLHEIGHGMGLAHPHNSSDPFPGVSSISDTGTNALNQGIWTTMTYNDGWTVEPTNTSDYGWQMTLMAFDIAALQAMYGANNTYNTDNNTYTIPTSSGSGVGWECIWDAGGSDTISNAGSNQGVTINLNAAPLVGENAGGYVSWISGVTGGYTIANNVVIENAIGGDGNDIITGNSADNTIHGNAGNNTIDGGAGNDTLVINANYADTAITITNSSNNSATITSNNGSFSNNISNIEAFAFNDQTLSFANLTVNTPPTLSTAISNAATNEDSAYSFNAAAHFNEVDVGDTLTYSATLTGGGALPSWLSINSTTGVLTGTPINTNVGAIDVTVTATDTSNASVSDTYTLTVNNTNDAPTLSTAISNATTNEDSAYSFNAAAHFNEVDVGDTLTYSATLTGGGALPSWLSINSTTGVLTGTPINTNVGAIDVTVTATDTSNASVGDTYTLTVNDLPELTNPIPNAVINENSTYNYNISGHFYDPDTLTYTATLPSWLSINSETGVISGTPVDGHHGTLHIQVTATDPLGGSTTDTYNLTVNNSVVSPAAPSTINTIVQGALSNLGYTNITGLTSNWDDGSNTLTLSCNSANNSSIPVIDYYNLNPADISQVVSFVMSEIGYSNISGMSTNWSTSSNTLNVTFNSAYISGYGIWVSNYSNHLVLDNYGNVSSYSSSAYNSTYGWLYYGASNLTSFERAIIKDAFIAIDALEDISASSTTNDVATIALTALGYSSVSGLNTSWNASTQTSTLSCSSVYSSSYGWLYNVQIVATTNSSGSITSYSSSGTNSSGYSFSFNQYDLDSAEVFVIEATNYALNAIDAVNSNDTFSNINATMVFDSAGNLADFSSSVTNSSVGVINFTENDLLTNEVAAIEQGYDDITSTNNDNIILNSGVNSSVDGGLGIDNIVIGSSYSDYTVGVQGNVIIIKDDNGNVTTITDVENFNFSDQSWSLQNLDNAVDHEDVRELYYEQVFNGTDYDQVWKMPDLYSFPENPGLEALIDYQYTGGIGGDIIIGTSGNEFINAGDGADAVNAGTGNDIIDGGLESNFLTGGTGNDIFFADGRDSSNETWTTITDFTDGTCSATLWGYIEGTSTYFWEENQGAGGQWNGATLRCDFDNNGVVDTSMTFTGMTQGQLNLATSSVFDPVSQTDLGYIMIT